MVYGIGTEAAEQGGNYAMEPYAAIDDEWGTATPIIFSSRILGREYVWQPPHR